MRLLLVVFICVFLPIASFAQSGDAEPTGSALTETASPLETSPERFEKVMNWIKEEQFSIREDLLKELDERADEQMGYFNIIIGLGSFIAVVVLGFLTYFAKTYIEGIGNTVKGLVRSEISDRLSGDENASDRIVKLLGSVKELESEKNRLEPILNALKEYVGLAEVVEKDPSGALLRARTLAREIRRLEDNPQVEAKQTKAKRDEILVLFAIIQEAALSGFFDPNETYNASAVAGRLDFDQAQLELATIAYWQKASASHLIGKLDVEHSMGMSFRVEGDKLERVVDKPADTIRQEAFSQALGLVTDAPTHQCEIIISRTWNMAERGREEGGHERFAEALDQVIDGKSPSEASGSDIVSYPPSYYYTARAQVHARNSKAGWKDRAFRAYNDALILLKTESPMATWYSSSMSAIIAYSRRAGIGDEVKKLAEDVGVELTDERDTQDERAAALEALMRKFGADEAGDQDSPDIL